MGRLQLARLHAKKAPGEVSDDRTVYGTTRISPTGFYEHHVQRIGSGAVVQDAIAITSSVKNKLNKLTNPM